MKRSANLLTIAVVSAAIAVLAAACLFRDLSGVSIDSKGRLLAVNNRPGLFALCEMDGDKFTCKKLAFRLSSFERWDLEGVTWVDENMFYAVSEKRNNQCFSACELSQDVVAFRIDEDGFVSEARCRQVRIPLFESDNEDCSFANCGLEAVAFDIDRNVLYVGKEMYQARLFRLELDKDHCPTGEFKEIEPPRRVLSYNDMHYSKKRRSLFVLSLKVEAFFEWNLPTNRIVFDSKTLPETGKFIRENIPVEGITFDERSDEIILLAESGKYHKVKLPDVRPVP